MSNLGPGEGLPTDELRRETTEAIEKLRSYEDESADPRLVSFAHFLAERIGADAIVPQGLTMVVMLATYDLRTGRDGWSGEAIQHELTGLEEEDYLRLFRESPKLAHHAFDKDFADAYVEQLRIAGILGREEPTPQEWMIDEAIITHEIGDIETAHREIVAGARDMVADLDWERFGIEVKDIYALFESMYGVLLRNAPYKLPLNVLAANKQWERGILDLLGDDRKKNIHGDFYLMMPEGNIPPDFATFARDHLFLKGQELVARALKSDDFENIMAQLGESLESPSASAAMRLVNFLEGHPEVLKNGAPLSDMLNRPQET